MDSQFVVPMQHILLNRFVGGAFRAGEGKPSSVKEPFTIDGKILATPAITISPVFICLGWRFFPQPG